jgi:pSer/pThr/pTyr-binding forkhead associated (FHA) protein
LSHFPSTIGRSSENDVQLPDLRVSRRHAELTQPGEAIELTDLGSSNGTLVNGRTVTHVTLKAGDQISLGGVILYVETDN